MSDTHPHNRACRELFARLSEYLDQELDPAVRQKIERHLASCRPCRVCLATLQRTAALCRSAAGASMPAAVSHRLRSFFARMEKDRSDR